MNHKSLNQEYAVNKSYSYSKNDIRLNFTLRLDKKDDVICFRDMLKKALGDVEEDITKL